MKRRVRQREILILLIEAVGEPVHVNQIADQTGRSRGSIEKFMLTRDDGLWVSGRNAAWWRTTLRSIPDRLQ